MPQTSLLWKKNFSSKLIGDWDIDGEEKNWGKLAIGSCELLAGALLAIIPCGLTRKIAAGIIVDGFRRMLNEAEEISEENELDQISQ